MNLRAAWEWLSRGKDFSHIDDAASNNDGDSGVVLSAEKRNELLKLEIQKRIEQGFTLQLEREFFAILSLERTRSLFLYFLVNVSLLLLFGTFWFAFFLIWTVFLIIGLLNRKTDTYRLEIRPNGEVLFESTNSLMKFHRWDKH